MGKELVIFIIKVLIYRSQSYQGKHRELKAISWVRDLWEILYTRIYVYIDKNLPTAVNIKLQEII